MSYFGWQPKVLYESQVAREVTAPGTVVCGALLQDKSLVILWEGLRRAAKNAIPERCASIAVKNCVVQSHVTALLLHHCTRPVQWEWHSARQKRFHRLSWFRLCHGHATPLSRRLSTE